MNLFVPSQTDTIRTNHPKFRRWRISFPENELAKTYIKVRRIMTHLSGCFLTIGKTPEKKMITQNLP